MKKGIYILPSLFTSGNLTCGFLSIVNALRERYILAATLIVIGIIFDILDGKISRLTGTSSDFGVELDSLADMVSFGVAPAILVYLWIGMPRGMSVVFLMYVLGGAMRLARFNVKATEHKDPDVYFRGLPIPAAAVTLVSMVLFFEKYQLSIPMPAVYALLILLSYLMVSHIEYYSFKKMKAKKRTPARMLWLMFLIIFLLYIRFTEMMFFISYIYLLSGITKKLLANTAKKQSADKEVIENEKNQNI